MHAPFSLLPLHNCDLEGGWCYDLQSCQGRSGNLASSKSWTSTENLEGIFDSTDARLADANLVYMPYCTSDAWIGNASSADVKFPFTFHMRGAAVVDAVVKELVATRGLGSAAGSAVMYSGCSAGARGVLFNVPRFQDVLTRALPTPSNVAVLGAFLDSAFWLDLPPYDTKEPPFTQEAQDVFKIANAAPQLNAACLAAYPGAAGWNCLMGVTALPFVAGTGIPYFFHSYQVRKRHLPRVHPPIA